MNSFAERVECPMVMTTKGVPDAHSFTGETSMAHGILIQRTYTIERYHPEYSHAANAKTRLVSTKPLAPWFIIQASPPDSMVISTLSIDPKRRYAARPIVPDILLWLRWHSVRDVPATYGSSGTTALCSLPSANLR